MEDTGSEGNSVGLLAYLEGRGAVSRVITRKLEAVVPHRVHALRTVPGVCAKGRENITPYHL